ncbi:hypothetical protein [Solibacillus daqui]|uniref:hypothetical protein n=1 Tax=Solibacillus daqui TaxID=2912187 RepID=UPI00236707D9|nr:hypothetical protein [Solibacillus daqui]
MTERKPLSISVDLNTDKMQLKLLAIAKHAEALADELDEIDAMDDELPMFFSLVLQCFTIKGKKKDRQLYMSSVLTFVGLFDSLVISSSVFLISSVV